MGGPETSVHVVCGMEGEYSDRREWVVAVYRDEQEARKWVQSTEAAVRAAAQEFSDHYSEAFQGALEAIDQQLDRYDWDSVRYRVETVPFHE